MLVALICGRRFDCERRNRTRVRLGGGFLARQPNPRRPSVDNAREGKRTLARKHGHLRVLLLSASESERGFGSVFHHQYSKSQLLSVGIFLPVPPLKTVMTSRASLRRRPDFPPDSRKFLSLLSVGTRALATSLRVFTTTYRQQVRQVFWSGGGESENKRHGVPEFTLVPADFAEDPAVGIPPRFLSPLASSLRSGAR